MRCLRLERKAQVCRPLQFAAKSLQQVECIIDFLSIEAEQDPDNVSFDGVDVQDCVSEQDQNNTQVQHEVGVIDDHKYILFTGEIREEDPLRRRSESLEGLLCQSTTSRSELARSLRRQIIIKTDREIVSNVLAVSSTNSQLHVAGWAKL